MSVLRRFTLFATGGMIDLRTDREILADYLRRLARERARHTPGTPNSPGHHDARIT